MSLSIVTSSQPEQWNNRALFRLIWPVVIEQVLAVTMGAADTVMVSYVGEFAVSGVNIIDNINNLLVIAFMALTTGGAVVCSQYIGRQDYKNSVIASRHLAYIAIVVSSVMTVITVLLRRPIISLVYGRIEADVMKAAMIYFLITALSYPFLALYDACAALFRSVGNTQVPMRIAILVNIMHIGGNLFFLFVLHTGVGGVALSTLVSRFVAAVVLFVMLMRKHRSPISFAGIWKIQINPSMVKKILHIGVPTGLENSMFQIGRLFTQRAFPYFGTSIIAANAVTSVVNSISNMPGNGFSMSLLTVVGQCLGAGNPEAAKRYTVKILKICWITIFVMSGLIFIFRDPLISLFNLSPEAHSAANTFLSVHCISMIIGWTFSFALPNALRAAGDARYVMKVGIISMWTVRVSAAYLLTFALGIGPVGVWISMGMDFVTRGIFFFIRWRRGRWQNMKVIDD
ncbi:MAG: MATE family efflux transporter [Treponema sp.]|nr:MATE family efflux transporter [Treponema sp.]